jgi:hypothetical protein
LKSTVVLDRLAFLLADVVVNYLVGDGAGCDNPDEVNLEVIARVTVKAVSSPKRDFTYLSLRLKARV